MLQFILFLLFTVFWVNMAVYAEPENNKPKNSFKIKGGIWGLSGSFSPEQESKRFKDSIDDDVVNSSWKEAKRLYLLNPLGFEYSMDSLVFGLDFYGFLTLQNIMGFKPTYDFNSIYQNSISVVDVNNRPVILPYNIIGFHINELTYRNMDLSIGYKFNIQKISITPKYFLRNFYHKYEEGASYIGNISSEGLVGVSYYNQRVSTWTGFVGADLLFDINQQSAIFLDFAVASPILGQWYSSGKYSELYFTGSRLLGNMGMNSGKLSQEITGSRAQLGYQHTFGGGFSLRIGYHSETIESSYKKYDGLPIIANYILNVSQAGISTFEIVSDRYFAYGAKDKTEIKSLYITLQYAF